LRNFMTDFCAPAMRDLSPKQAQHVGIALDCAILFGVLEYIEGNESLRVSKEVLQRTYDEKIARLT
jgi:hypothetical protein